MIKKKTIVGILAVILSALMVFFLINIIFGDGLGKALDAKKYNTVQVKALLKTAYIGKDKESNTKSDSNAENEPKEITIMQKYGDIIYESGISGKHYFYQRNKKPYVLYYDTMYGIKEEKGKWIETQGEKFNMLPLFDFSSLSELSKSYFKKENGVYRPSKKNLNKVFFTLFNISKTNQSKYSVNDLQLKIKNNLFESITANYVYSESYVTEQTLLFSYKDIKLVLPVVDEVFKG